MTQTGYLILVDDYDCSECRNLIRRGLPYIMAVSVEGKLQCPECAHAKVMSGEIILMKKLKDSDEKEHREPKDKRPLTVLRDKTVNTSGRFTSATEYDAKYSRRIPR